MLIILIKDQPSSSLFLNSLISRKKEKKKEKKPPQRIFQLFDNLFYIYESKSNLKGQHSELLSKED
jgi:hypothetical protein